MFLFDSPKDEWALKYAFVLAIRHHLVLIKDNLLNYDYSKEKLLNEEIEMQQRLVDINIIIKFGIDKISNHYKYKNFEESKNQIDQCHSFNFEDFFFGNNLNIEQTFTLKTEDLIKLIEEDYKDDKSDSVETINNSKLQETFYFILKNVFFLHKESFGIKSESDEFGVISLFVETYLKKIIEENDASINLTEPVISKIKLITFFLNPDKITNLNLDLLYIYFKKHFAFHLNLINYKNFETKNSKNAVDKLREFGNNLMMNQAYAQSIQVYTEALSLCGSILINNIPQLLNNRAIAYIGLNCFPEAINELNKAVQLDRCFVPAWTQLGYCYLYMGSSLIALKSYLIALKSLVGEVLPKNFPFNNKSFLNSYKSFKMKTILPQFVQRICQSIALTEKRAYQQNESSSEIRTVINDVRRILVILRSDCPESDRNFYTYVPHIRNSMLRSISERANRSRPNILTHDVAQYMLTSNGIETMTVTNRPRNLFDRIERNNTNLSNNNESDNISSQNTGLNYTAQNETSSRNTTTHVPNLNVNVDNDLNNDFLNSSVPIDNLGNLNSYTHTVNSVDFVEGNEDTQENSNNNSEGNSTNQNNNNSNFSRIDNNNVRHFLNLFGNLTDARINISGYSVPLSQISINNPTPASQTNEDENMFRDIIGSIFSENLNNVIRYTVSNGNTNNTNFTTNTRSTVPTETTPNIATDNNINVESNNLQDTNQNINVSSTDDHLVTNDSTGQNNNSQNVNNNSTNDFQNRISPEVRNQQSHEQDINIDEFNYDLD